MSAPQVFDLNEGVLFRARDGKLYVARFDVVYAGEWEVFQARIEWWRSESTCYTDEGE